MQSFKMTIGKEKVYRPSRYQPETARSRKDEKGTRFQM